MFISPRRIGFHDFAKGVFIFCFFPLFQGCAFTKPIQTKPYSWRHKIYKKEKPSKDWFIPLKGKEKTFEQEFGLCAKPTIRPYLYELKKITKQCTEVAEIFQSAASSTRLGYFFLVGVGAVGGAAVLSGPIFSTLKVQVPAGTQDIDAGLILTVSGAALTSVAVFWLQLGDLGNISNKSFKQNANIVRLIQNAESVWNTKVCHARSTMLAKLNATKILRQMSKQCVKNVPDVQVNPDISGNIRKQQGEVRSIIANYQVLQGHMNDQSKIESSERELDNLIRQIQRERTTLIQSMHKPEVFLRSKLRLKSLCAQAQAESAHLTLLRNRRKKQSEHNKQGVPIGGWNGICQSIQTFSSTQKQLALQRQYRISQTKKATLIQQIQSLHSKLRVRQNPQNTQIKPMKGYCLQAQFEHRREIEFAKQLNRNKRRMITTPGAWAGICKLYYPDLSTAPTSSKK